MLIVAEVGVSTSVLNFIAAILQESGTTVDDGMVEFPSFTQAIGLGEQAKATLILCFAKGPLRSNRRAKEVRRSILNADDLVIYGSNKFQMQQALKVAVALTKMDQ